jgi:hypothetical protein
LAIGAVALSALAVTGAVFLLRPPGPAATPAASVFDHPIALTSPAASRPPRPGDPNTPAYAEGSGFTPDATKVLTVAVLQVSLARYHDASGSYPASLAALFPTYAPLGPDGAPMASPPAGFAYSPSPTGYRLSVTLADGSLYSVEGD